MPAKPPILEAPGERALLVPELVAQGLAANDRLNYYLSLLQAAQAHANAPLGPAADLRTEREASGISDPALDHIVESSLGRGNGTTYIPGARVIFDRLVDELRRMLMPLHAAGRTRADLRERGTIYERRLETLVAAMPTCSDDQVSSGTIAALTTLQRNGHDTVHQLIVDLHGELSRLQAGLSAEEVHGASARGLNDDDRALLQVFMTGLRQTSKLKFDHPGLTTTAVRDDNRLSIQNDIVATDAHVVVVQVEGLAVTVICTDVHRSRIRFFQDLLKPYGLTWAMSPDPDAAFETAVGQYPAGTHEHLTRFLSYIASRLVFLIDWSRARKRLSRLVSRTEATAVLKWAADNSFGHRAFLECGDVHLIETAFERAAPAHARYGRLDELFGRDAARLFLMAVLRTTSAGLIAGQSLRLIEDKVEAELLRYLQSPDRHVLGRVAEHATMIAALAEHVRLELLRRRHRKGPDAAQPSAHVPAVADSWTERADDLIQQQRHQADSSHELPALRPLMAEASGAASALDEMAFMLSLLPPDIEKDTSALLEALADQTATASREYVRCLEEGQNLSRVSDRPEIDAFLVTIDRLTTSGKDASVSQRAIIERVMLGTGSSREVYALTKMADGFGRAAATLVRCGSMVRDLVLRTRLTR
jgi:hypothetical protein